MTGPDPELVALAAVRVARQRIRVTSAELALAREEFDSAMLDASIVLGSRRMSELIGIAGVARQTAYTALDRERKRRAQDDM